MRLARIVYCKREGITGQIYARRLKASYMAYRNAENLKSFPSYSLLKRIADLTGTSLTWLLLGTGSPEQPDEPHMLAEIECAIKTYGERIGLFMAAERRVNDALNKAESVQRRLEDTLTTLEGIVATLTAQTGQLTESVEQNDGDSAS